MKINVSVRLYGGNRVVQKTIQSIGNRSDSVRLKGVSDLVRKLYCGKCTNPLSTYEQCYFKSPDLRTQRHP